MASKADIAEFTAAARAAYNGAEFVGLYTSAMHASHCIGLHLRETGRPEPRDVRPSRGDTMHANDCLWRLDWHNVKHPTITRER